MDSYGGQMPKVAKALSDVRIRRLKHGRQTASGAPTLLIMLLGWSFPDCMCRFFTKALKRIESHVLDKNVGAW